MADEKKYNYVYKTARVNGKKYTATGKTELEAMTKLADKLSAAKRGEEILGGSMSVAAWFVQWKETYKKSKNITPKSLRMYDDIFECHIRPSIGTMKLQDVRELHLQKILNRLNDKSASLCKKVRMVLKAMFKKARQLRIIPYDPAEGLELPTVKSGSRRSITDEERDAILAVAETHRSGLWILTLLYTGMRPGETAALRWRDVDFVKKEIHIHAAKEAGSKTIKAPKTAAGVRTVPIRAALLPKLRAAKKRPNDWVFPTGSGGQQNDRSLRRLWTGFRRDLDIYMGAELYRNEIVRSALAPDLVPYCLRHTFCTDLEREGVPINVAKELMGHSDISVTGNIYTHTDTSILHKYIDKMDEPPTQNQAPG